MYNCRKLNNADDKVDKKRKFIKIPLSMITQKELLRLSTPTESADGIGALIMQERLKFFLDMLTERERNVLIHRFGMDTYSKSRKEIGKMFGVCGARVGQIERRAIKKIKAYILQEVK